MVKAVGVSVLEASVACEAASEVALMRERVEAVDWEAAGRGERVVNEVVEAVGAMREGKGGRGKRGGLSVGGQVALTVAPASCCPGAPRPTIAHRHLASDHHLNSSSAFISHHRWPCSTPSYMQSSHVPGTHSIGCVCCGDSVLAWLTSRSDSPWLSCFVNSNQGMCSQHKLNLNCFHHWLRQMRCSCT